jgi:ABC-type dipeptide/oligopeptide/nickel transport system permease subunit
MAENVVNVNNISTTAAPRISEWKRFRRVFLSRVLVIFGLVILVCLLIMAIFAPLLAPYPPNLPDLNSVLLGPSSGHWFGTDALGRDTLSRILYGAQTSLEVGLIVVAVACTSGIIIGLVAGYYGGWVNAIIMRFIDAFMAFPMILLALVIAALLGNGMRNVIIALSVAMMPAYARMMCGQVLSVKENDYVVAGRSIGASNLRIMIMHVVPNCLSPLIVMITMMLGSVILAEAGLSFLGIGIAPPTPSWGSMINDGQQYLLDLPVLSFAPGFVLMLAVFAFNMVGDGLRDALDPSLRGTL